MNDKNIEKGKIPRQQEMAGWKLHPACFQKYIILPGKRKAEKCRERALLPSGIAGFLGYRFLQRLRHFSQKTGKGNPQVADVLQN